MDFARFLLCSMMLYFGVHSFDAGWTTNVLTSEDTTHYGMTECALLQLASDYLRVVYDINTLGGVINIKNGQCAVKPIYNAVNVELNKLRIDKKRLSAAIKTIARTNTRTDRDEISNEAAHFDSERFDDGARLISQLLDAAVTSLEAGEYEQARETFGSLLHTIQDFYSHSNWIEIGHRDPNTGMGKYEILGRYASLGMRTCVDCEGVTCRTNIEPSVLANNILTSGYFGLKVLGIEFGGKVKPVGKCSHGGPNDYTVQTDARGGGINKDNLESDHGYLHRIAASVAYDATKQILNELWTKVGKEAFGQFLGLSENLRNLSAGSLIIVMDDTGSMGSYIAMAKQIAIGLVDIHRTLEYQPSNYILSPFNDPTWGPLTISKTPEEFTNEISKLYAHGGGDEPELYYHGVVDALKVCDVGSFMYTFTDAPAKDAYLKSQAIQLAREKHVTVTLFYAKNFMRKAQTGRAFDRIADVIEYLGVSDGSDLSSLTGGVTMGVNNYALNATKDYIVQRLATDQLNTILFAKGQNTTLNFYVDASVDKLKIEVTSTRSLPSTGLLLTKPSGERISPNPTSQTPFIRMYTVPIESDDTGRWTLISSMNSEHTLQLDAISNISCSSTLQKEIIDTSSNINFTPLMSQPIKQENDLFVLTVCEDLPFDLKTGYVELIDARDASNVLERLSPIRTSSTGFLSRITIPGVAFRIRTLVQLQDDTIIQRQEKQTISPTSISLTIKDQPYTVVLDNSFVMNYTIHNHEQFDQIITLRVTDTLSLLSQTGFVNSYRVAGSSNFSGSVEVNTFGFSAMSSNSSVVTDSVVFSIATSGYEYNEVAPLYIIQRVVPLTNQSNYQVPPKTNVASKNFDSFSIILSLFVVCLFLKFY